MTERIDYVDLDESIVGRQLVGLSHVGEDPRDLTDPAAISDRDGLRRTKPEIVGVARLDESVTIGVGDQLRGLEARVASENVTVRQSTRIDEKPVQGWLAEYGIGPGGWIEVVE